MLDVAASPSSFGAAIAGAVLSRLDNSDFNRIHRALGEHSVLAIAGQAMNAAEFAAFAARFGTALHGEPARLRHPRQPEILVLQCAGDSGESALHALYALKISSGDCGLEFSRVQADDKFRHVLRAGDVLVWDARRTSCQASCNGDAGNTLYRIAVAEHG